MKISYRIEGMQCGACVEKIKSVLSSYQQAIEVTLKPPRLHIEGKIIPALQELNARLATIGNYQLHEIVEKGEAAQENKSALKNYYPIFLIAAYIGGVAFVNNFHGGVLQWNGWMNQFMAGFFLVFSAFKLLDIRGFVEGYATYDLLARRWRTYGFIYPFIELGLGILYVGLWFPVMTSIITIVVMGFSTLGVVNSLIQKQKIRCACLGTLLNVPLSTITLVEDLTMVVLAIVSLLAMD